MYSLRAYIYYPLAAVIMVSLIAISVLATSVLQRLSIHDIISPSNDIIFKYYIDNGLLYIIIYSKIYSVFGVSKNKVFSIRYIISDNNTIIGPLNDYILKYGLFNIFIENPSGIYYLDTIEPRAIPVNVSVRVLNTVSPPSIIIDDGTIGRVMSSYGYKYYVAEPLPAYNETLLLKPGVYRYVPGVGPLFMGLPAKKGGSAYLVGIDEPGIGDRVNITAKAMWIENHYGYPFIRITFNNSTDIEKQGYVDIVDADTEALPPGSLHKAVFIYQLPSTSLSDEYNCSTINIGVNITIHKLYIESQFGPVPGQANITATLLIVSDTENITRSEMTTLPFLSTGNYSIPIEIHIKNNTLYGNTTAYLIINTTLIYSELYRKYTLTYNFTINGLYSKYMYNILKNSYIKILINRTESYYLINQTSINIYKDNNYYIFNSSNILIPTKYIELINYAESVIMYEANPAIIINSRYPLNNMTIVYTNASLICGEADRYHIYTSIYTDTVVNVTIFPMIITNDHYLVVDRDTYLIYCPNGTIVYYYPGGMGTLNSDEYIEFIDINIYSYMYSKPAVYLRSRVLGLYALRIEYLGNMAETYMALGRGVISIKNRPVKSLTFIFRNTGPDVIIVSMHYGVLGIVADGAIRPVYQVTRSFPGIVEVSAADNTYIVYEEIVSATPRAFIYRPAYLPGDG